MPKQTASADTLSPIQRKTLEQFHARATGHTSYLAGHLESEIRAFRADESWGATQDFRLCTILNLARVITNTVQPLLRELGRTEALADSQQLVINAYACAKGNPDRDESQFPADAKHWELVRDRLDSIEQQNGWLLNAVDDLLKRRDRRAKAHTVGKEAA